MRSADQFLLKMARPGPDEIKIESHSMRPGIRVRLKPRPGGDILDAFFAGRTAVVEGIDQDESGQLHVSVVLDDDPGRDMGGARHPAHRFFFKPYELELLENGRKGAPKKSVLIAGIGNIFFGDDGFGVEVANRLLGRKLPETINVVELGIRGMDLAYALGRPHHAAIIIDAAPRGAQPGSIHILEPNGSGGFGCPDAHHMDPMAVLELARRIGPVPAQIIILGCEPETYGKTVMSMGLSAPVAAAVERAADLAMEIAGHLLAGRKPVFGGNLI